MDVSSGNDEAISRARNGLNIKRYPPIISHIYNCAFLEIRYIRQNHLLSFLLSLHISRSPKLNEIF